LKELNLRRNRISDLSPIASLKSLVKADVRYNKLEDLPDLIGFMNNLKSLYVSANPSLRIRQGIIDSGSNGLKLYLR
jgi:Leucine-rich repeat (LRR) protein